ncbi:TMAO reductase system periplasmic protein TorT [Rhabdochromatium marinum]|uniref:TMAO reductase system periplasmic protein TorT n=1 Tax=Rhabdochromatium marinum TaxID=48729 RepID=UPI001905828D|nr:TMAO reductase system periplasmic protein TorT [Rhabdochromatium marinum]MBK1649880.1 TMAO reductase system periplasmic protein TorT [Rhabdochromatium marinum]
MLILSGSAQALSVGAYYGDYDTATKQAGHPATSLRGPFPERWSFTAQAKRPYRIGVLFPHLKDPYWVAVNFGIAQRAAASGVDFQVLVAGGYSNLAGQIQQLSQLREQPVDGIILAGVSYDKLDAQLAETRAAGIPVVAVINDIQAPDIAAKSLVSFYDMGFKLGDYLRQQIAGHDGEQTVAFLPGPKDTGWAPESLQGFTDALADVSTITLLPPLWGDTNAKTQRSLIRRAFHFYPKIDYLVGNAVMALVAPEALAQLGAVAANTRVLSTYLIPQVYNHIADGKVAAAAADMNIDQGRIALDMIVKCLDGQRPGVDFAFRAGPRIPVITADTIGDFPFEQLFGTRGFKPVLDSRAVREENAGADANNSAAAPSAP